MSLIPPLTGNDDLDYFNTKVADAIDSIPFNGINYDTGIVVDDTNVISRFLYRYLGIKFADDNQGTGFSDYSANKSYYGLYNSRYDAESGSWTSYTWYEATFGASDLLYYRLTSNRTIDFLVSSTPVTGYTAEPTSAIDMDAYEPPANVFILNKEVIVGPTLSVDETMVGNFLFHPISDDNPLAITIDDEATTPIDVGSMITIVNFINDVTVTQASGFIYQASTGLTGTWLIIPHGKVTLLKVESNTWVIDGDGFYLS